VCYVICLLCTPGSASTVFSRVFVCKCVAGCVSVLRAVLMLVVVVVVAVLLDVHCMFLAPPLLRPSPLPGLEPFLGAVL